MSGSLHDRSSRKASSRSRARWQRWSRSLKALAETQSIILDSREKRNSLDFEKLLEIEMAAKLLELDAQSCKVINADKL